MALAGNNATVNVGVDVIKEVTSADWSMDSNQIDITGLGLNWREFISTIKGATCSLTAFYDPTDTNGQVVLRDAFLANTPVADFRYLVDGATGFSATVNVSAFNLSTAFDNAIEATYELQITGDVTVV